MKYLTLCTALALSLSSLASCDDGKASPGDIAAEVETGDTSGDVTTDAPTTDVADASDSADADSAEVDASVPDIPDTANACPTEMPGPEATCSTEGKLCGIGKECCCEKCYPSLSCKCTGGSWACFATDACLIPGCPGDASSGDPDASPDTSAPDAGPDDATATELPPDVAE